MIGKHLLMTTSTEISYKEKHDTKQLINKHDKLIKKLNKP